MTMDEQMVERLKSHIFAIYDNTIPSKLDNTKQHMNTILLTLQNEIEAIQNDL